MSRTEAQLDRLIEDLHHRRLRVWSIIISFFGDAISPRGGVMWVSTLRPLAARLRIEGGALGAALSRLAADGWLVRDKRGRNTMYRIDANGQAAFDAAAERIYGTQGTAQWTGRWTLVIGPSDEPPGDGFVRLDTRTWARPDLEARPSPATILTGARFEATAQTTPAVLQLIDDAFGLEPVGEAYRRWLARFAPVVTTLGSASLEPLSAMCIRLLMVHEFRRIVLRDPPLPDALRRPHWPGFEARDTAAALYRAVLADSEAWLDSPDRTPDGPLPQPDPSFFRRFGGLNSLHHKA